MKAAADFRCWYCVCAFFFCTLVQGLCCQRCLRPAFNSSRHCLLHILLRNLHSHCSPARLTAYISCVHLHEHIYVRSSSMLRCVVLVWFLRITYALWFLNAGAVFKNVIGTVKVLCVLGWLASGTETVSMCVAKAPAVLPYHYTCQLTAGTYCCTGSYA
jgi:hypothetical protein